jgi:hypothetical protein
MSIGHAFRISNPDMNVYRWISLEELRDRLTNRRMLLKQPYRWDDPFENILVSCGVTFTGGSDWREVFFDKLRKPIYAQCWTALPESDALWRIYSQDKRSVRIRSTPRKLLSALAHSSPSLTPDDCFIGTVVYLSQNDLGQHIANMVGRDLLDAFSGPKGHAESVLFKRDAFAHEDEVRLIYVDSQSKFVGQDVLAITADPAKVFDEITLDPRVTPDDAPIREKEILDMGYAGIINKSLLYMGVIFEICIDKPCPLP